MNRLLLKLVLIALAVSACGGDGASVDLVDPGEAEQLLGEANAVLLDIRTPEEFSEVRIEGALNIDFYSPDFAAQIGRLDPDATYVVYCRSGNRSASARATFEELGFGNVNEIEGGILTWVDAGLPTVDG